MVDQVADTPLVTRSGASPVTDLNNPETLSKPESGAFERLCAIHGDSPKGDTPALDDARDRLVGDLTCRGRRLTVSPQTGGPPSQPPRRDVARRAECSAEHSADA